MTVTIQQCNTETKYLRFIKLLRNNFVYQYILKTNMQPNVYNISTVMNLFGLQRAECFDAVNVVYLALINVQ